VGPVSLQISSNEEERILECVDRGLDVFGSSVKTVIYHSFQVSYNQDRKDIIRKPELFSQCLRSFFGERAFHVEAAIVAVISDRLHPVNVTLSDSLTRAIVEARNQSRR
jgi:hypothetical protein